MKIAILSDSHDNHTNLLIAMKRIKGMNAEVLLFCGDFVSPGSAKVISEFNRPVYVVFGNNDGDKMNISRLMREINANVTFFEESGGALELEGRKIMMTHYPRYAQALARTGDYDLVCFGHDHKARIEAYGECLAVNPGCLNPVRPTDVVGFAVYDTETHQAVLYDLNGQPLS